MEQPERDAVTMCDVTQHALCLIDLPLGGRDPGILVRVGVTDHDLLGVAACCYDGPVAPIREKLVEQGTRAAELGHTLEKRDDADAGPTTTPVDEPGLTCKHDRGKDVVDAFGHRYDVALDHPVTEAVKGSRNRFESRIGRGRPR